MKIQLSIISIIKIRLLFPKLIIFNIIKNLELILIKIN